MKRSGVLFSIMEDKNGEILQKPKMVRLLLFEAWDEFFG